MRVKWRRELRVADHVIGNHVLQQIEPEQRKLRQHAAFVGYSGGQHHVERRQPVRRDDQQPVAEIVNVAHLAAGGR